MKKIVILSLVALFINILFFGFIKNSQAESVFKKSNKELKNFAESKLSFSDFDTSVSGIVSNVMLLVNTIFFIFMIYAGILWATSAGSEDKISKAKSILVWCVIGIFVTFSSYSITNFVLQRVGGQKMGGATDDEKVTCEGSLRGTCKKKCDVSYIDDSKDVEIGYGELDCKDDTVCCVPK